MANSYRVSFGHDPYATSGGGMLSAFEPVPGTVYLDEHANLEVRTGSTFPVLCQVLNMKSGSRVVHLSAHAAQAVVCTSGCALVNLKRSAVAGDLIWTPAAPLFWVEVWHPGER